MSNVVMSGSLGAFDVPAILQAMSLSRQYTRLRLWNDGNAKTGEIRMKAGQILQAESSKLIGKDAFRAILDGTHATFSVERCEDPQVFGTPLGTIASLLLSASVGRKKAKSAELEQDLLTISTTLTGSAIIANDPAPPVLTPSAAPPPIPARTSSKATKAPPKKAPAIRPEKQPAPQAGVAFDGVIEDRLADYHGLEFLVLSALEPSSFAPREWTRGAARPVAQESTQLVTQAFTSAVASRGFRKPPARVMVEFADRTVVGQRLDSKYVVVCGFDGSVPLGAVLHICKAIEPTLERLLRAQTKTARLAG